MSKLKIFAVFIFLILCVHFYLAGQTGLIGDMKIFQNIDNGIKIEVYNVIVKKMKNREIEFGFQLSQQGEVIVDSWRPIDPVMVIYDPAYWNDLAFWCTYSYDFLKKAGNESQTFYCTFYIIASEEYETIEEKTIEFKIESTKPGPAKSKEDTKVKSKADNVIIEYTTAQDIKIIIQDGVLTYYHVQDIKTVDNNPVSGNTYAEYSASEYKMSPADIQTAVNAFYNNGWQKLKNDYGVSKDDRHYPTTLRLSDSKGDKTVTYRKGAIAENKPPAEFYTIIASLVKIADQYANN